MSKEKLTAVGSLGVGCLVRVATDDPPVEIEGTVTGIRRCDGGVMMTFKSADQQVHTQHIAVAVLGPLLHNLWGGYDITILKPAPMQQSISGMRPA